MELPNPYVSLDIPEYPGRDRHIAFLVNSINSLSEKLIKYEITHSHSTSGRRAIFCRDCDFNALEFVEM